MKARAVSIVQTGLAILLLIIALNAFGGGWYGIAGAREVPVEWLHDTPFNSYFLPGLFLFVVVGGTCLVNSIGAFLRKKWAMPLGVFTGLLLNCWIITQWYFIGFVSWLQPAVFVSGVVIVILALVMKNLRAQVSEV